MIIYGRLYTDVTLNCPFRQSVTGSISLLWIGPPYTGDLGTTYITSNDGANPNTVLGNRLSVVGNHTAGEYNMKISNLQKSDEGKYSCIYGNQRKYFDLRVAVPVTSITISPTTVSVVEGRSLQVTCTSSDSFPAASVKWYILRQGLSTAVKLTIGVNNTQHNMKTISTLLYTGDPVDNAGHLYCSATIEEQNIPVQSENSSMTVLYPPKLEPVLTGYTPGSILYDYDLDLLLNCQQEGGNPLSVIRWLDITEGVTDNSTRHISSSYIELFVSRQLHGYTCTCLVTYPGTHANYRRNISVTFSLLYLRISEASGTKTYESTDRVGSVLIRTIPGQLSNRTNTLEIPFSGYQDIGIYICHGYNKYNRRMKSQDIQINVNVSQNEGMPNSTVIAVVVGVILMSVLTIGGILSFVCIRRKRKENNSTQRPTQCDIGEDKITYDNIDVQSKSDETTYEMKEQVKDLSNVYEELQQQNDTEGFYNSITTLQ